MESIWVDEPDARSLDAIRRFLSRRRNGETIPQDLWAAIEGGSDSEDTTGESWSTVTGYGGEGNGTGECEEWALNKLTLSFQNSTTIAATTTSSTTTTTAETATAALAITTTSTTTTTTTTFSLSPRPSSRSLVQGHRPLRHRDFKKISLLQTIALPYTTPPCLLQPPPTSNPQFRPFLHPPLLLGRHRRSAQSQRRTILQVQLPP
jgi:hypothetical protein